MALQNRQYSPNEQSDFNPFREVKDFLFKSKRNMVATIGAGLLAFSSCVYNTATSYVAPNEWGVKQREFAVFGEKGIMEKNYETGVKFVMPMVEKMHIFPKDTLVLDLSKSRDKSRHRDVRRVNAAHIQTSDGFWVDLDVSLMYRITDPYKLITTIGGGRLYEDNGIIPKAEPVLKETLGQLDPKDFYDVTKRVPKQEEARLALNEILAVKGLEVQQVLIRYPTFHPKLQERFEDRILQDQLVHTNEAKKRLAVAEAMLTDITELGTQSASNKRQEGEAYRVTKEGEIEKYQRSQASEGDKLVALAEAQSTVLINKAYEGEGADLLVGLKMAQNLGGLKKVYVPLGGQSGFNPLDVDKVVDRISGKVIDGDDKR